MKSQQMLDRRIRQLLTLTGICFTAICLMVSGSGCASIVPPTGGPTDSLPPILLLATPADSTLHFNARRVTLTFNEYVEVEEVQKNLLVSPTPKTFPFVTNKLKNIAIQIKDTLEPNTTYTFNFGKSIKDLNEGNVFRNFTYILSTGDHFDSLKLSGRVLVAETGKADTTLIVALYNNFDDSAVVKDRSRYLARVDTTGFFQFDHLAPGRFKVYALKDEGQRRYFSKSDLFAFLDTPVTSQSQRNDLMLYAFRQSKEENEDSVSIPATTRRRKKLDDADKILKVQTNITGDKLDLLSTPEISVAEDPFKTFDTTKVRLLSGEFQPLGRYYFRKDSTNKKVSLIYNWKENTKYNILLDSAFAEDTLGRRVLRPDTIAFQTKKLTEYGSMKLRFVGLDLKRNPVLNFLQNDKIMYSYIFKNNNQFNAEIFQPGDYDLRIILDDNRNGVWDSGEFFGKHKQPEKVILIKRKLTVKPNWDNQVDIEL